VAGADATLKIDINISQVEKKLSKTEQRLKKVKDLAASLGKAETALFDGRSIKGGNKALEELAGKLKAASQSTFKFANNVAGLDKQIGKLQSVIRSAKTDTDEFRNAIAAAERAQMSLFRARGSVMKTRGQDLMGGLTGDLPGKLIADSSSVFKSIDALSNYRNELTRIFNAVEIGSPVFKQLETEIKKVNALLEKPKTTKTPNITRGIGGLAGREQALKEALRIQNQLETGSDAHIKSIVGVRKAQQAYNQELRISKTIQSALNLDLIVWKKLLDSVPAIMGKIAGGMKGLFMGKFGKLGQAAGVIGVSSAIEQLIQKIPFLDQGLKNNIQKWASWTQRAVEGITGVTIAYTALSGLLGSAQWVVGAIAGFVQFEAAASKVVWSIEGNITRAFSAFGRLSRELPQLAQAIAMTMPQALGGLGLGGSWEDYMAEGSQAGKIADALGGGKGRKEARRYTRQGPTELQNAQKDLNQINKMLEQRNTTSKGYTELLRRQIQAKVKIKELQKGINQFVDKTLQNEIAAGNVYAKDAYPQEYLEHINKSKEALKDLNKLETQNRDQQRQDADKLIKDRGQARFDEVKKRWQLEATGHKNEMKRIKERQAAERQRTANRRKAMSRFGENVMLGAGFPMLFGGGPGAVAGGLTGAIGQSAMGSQGFGMQILFSALGQQVDAFVGKTAELGKAFNKINPDVDAVIGSLGEVNTEYGKHLEMLKKIKGEEAAFEAARSRLVNLIGQGGVQNLDKFGQNMQTLQNEWKKFTTLLMTSVAELINSSGILLRLTQAVGQAARFKSAYRAANEGNEEMALLFAMREGIENRTTTGKYSERKKAMEELKEWDQKIDAAEIRRQNSLGTKDLLGSGADKAAALQEEIHLLEQSFKLGSKKAQIEQEVAQYYKDQGKNVKDMLPAEVENVRQQFKRRDALKEQLEVWNQIKETIASGLTNAIMGLVEGTKSLKEALAGILKQIAQIILQKAILSVIDKTFTFGSGGVASGGTTAMVAADNLKYGNTFPAGSFSTGGMVTRPTVGLVGEAGEDEYIIPASKMAASMQRYSAGARGEAVIPGTGSSYAGGGAGGSTTVNYSGPILNFNSEEFVPKSAVGQIIASAAKQGASMGETRTMKSMQNNRSARARIGM
jgi:hypothetical protein